ncbi:MAG: PTS sugar transporter subunit IIA [Thermoanaerobaculia bacterium]
MGLPLAALIRRELIFPDLAGENRDTLLKNLAQAMAERGAVRDGEMLYRRLQEREALGTTGIGSGVAIPHCKIERLDGVVVAVGLSRQGVAFDAVDDQPVRLFFLVLSPPDAPAEHLKSLAAISRWAKADRHAERLLALSNADAIFDMLREEAA